MSTKISVYRGDDYSSTLTLTNSDTGAAIDITEYEFRLTVRTKDSLSDLDSQSEDSSSVINKVITEHTDPTNGLTTISIDNDETNIAGGWYVYDIQMKDANGNITTILKGEFEVLNDVTRAIS